MRDCCFSSGHCVFQKSGRSTNSKVVATQPAVLVQLLQLFFRTLTSLIGAKITCFRDLPQYVASLPCWLPNNLKYSNGKFTSFQKSSSKFCLNLSQNLHVTTETFQKYLVPYQSKRFIYSWCLR